MAEVQEQQVEDQQQEQEQADQFADADAKGAVEQEAEAPSLEDLASGMGWVPKDKFQGNETEWKPAHEFIRAGKDIQRSLSRELKDLRGTLDTVAKTSASILQERLAEQRAELSARYQKAVDDGKPDEAWQAANGIMKLDAAAQETITARPAPHPDAVEWSQRNSRVAGDPLAMQRAVQLCEPYARAGKSAGEQLASIEPMLRREFPHLFDGQETKAPPGVAQPTRMNGTQKKSETYAELPREAKAIADDMLDRGLIKDREMYARNYFAQARKGQ
jgi:hypothetical protein